MTFRNDCASLRFYNQSIRGKVQDFVISFEEYQKDLELVMRLTFDLFDQLIKSFKGKTITARLVAKVNFHHLSKEGNETDERAYHFSSYSSEKIDNVQDFFKRHMEKIASRLDSFNSNGSNLLIKNIEHLHILLTFTEKDLYAK